MQPGCCCDSGARVVGPQCFPPAFGLHAAIAKPSSVPPCAIPLLCVPQLYPDSLAVTNSWAYAGDHDLAGVEVGGEHASEGGLITLHFRRDKKVWPPLVH